MSETPQDVFEEVLRQLQDWKWERWTFGTAAEFQAKLDEDSRRWRERFRIAHRLWLDRGEREASEEFRREQGLPPMNP